MLVVGKAIDVSFAPAAVITVHIIEHFLNFYTE